MFCSLVDLVTESDVEQKLLWPLLTANAPSGLELLSSDVITKPNIRRIEIGKGSSRKLYFPDYLVVLAGLPVLVIEAKAPGASIDEALREARLYGNELNAIFPAGINPCARVIVCNGGQLATAPVDTSQPDMVIDFVELTTASASYARLIEHCQKSTLQAHADRIRRRCRKPTYTRALSLVGGLGFQNEELAPNTFGATIVGDYGHIFNPRTREERAYVVRNAYIRSLRRQRYVEPIDRLIRSAVTPVTSPLRVIDDTGEPKELINVLRDRRALENQVLLLVGSVGSGKSTFIDYVSVVALPEEVREKTIWVRVNLNEAPLAPSVAYSWLAQAISAELCHEFPNQDVEELSVIEKVFGPELNALRRGPLALLDQSSVEYKTRIADSLLRLRADEIRFAKALARYVCSGPGKLLVVALDNCDKRTRDEQLTMFQIAQWVQTEFKSLVVLPLRDVTFDRHRHEPPLDTALKGLVFRIEPPQFTEVLQARVRLALQEMQANAATAHTLSYVLPNGIRVTYPAADQALYLASILQSLYAHDRFVRRVMTGLAGRDVRRALEIFLDFCTSGHIGEDEIYKIRFFEGKYVLPQSVLARVLLRMQRRFYDGNTAYIKNLVQCHPEDPLPDHFVRLSILHWLEQHQSVKGPAGVTGFHAVQRMVQDLVQLSHDAARVREEILYLVKEGCIIPEHQRLDAVGEGDLVKITASGLVHLQLMANPDYLAACAEDTWVSDPEFARRVSTRISSHGLVGHFSRTMTSKNAWELVEYLKGRVGEAVTAPEAYLEKRAAVELKTLREAEAAVGATEIEVSKRLYVGNIPFDATGDDLRDAFRGVNIGLVNVTIPPDASGRRNRGYAFVEVESGRAAMEALDSTELRLHGRQFVVNEAHPLAEKDERRKETDLPRVDLSERLYLGNLPYSANEATVQSLFESHGLHPLEIYLAFDRQAGRSKGFAFAAMASIEEAARAIGALNGSIVDGRSIVVRPAAPRTRLGDEA